LQNNIRTNINFHNEHAQCYAIWQSSSQTRLPSGILGQLSVLPDSQSFAIPRCLRRNTGDSGASNPFRLGESLPLVRFSISSAISPDRFVVQPLVRVARLIVSHISCSRNGGDKEIVQYMADDKSSYERLILRKDLKAYQNN